MSSNRIEVWVPAEAASSEGSPQPPAVRPYVYRAPHPTAPHAEPPAHPLRRQTDYSLDAVTSESSTAS